MSELTAVEVAEATLAYLQRPPLVWIEYGYFVFRDEDHEGFRYDFRPTDALECMDWVAHMAGKSWVTTDHLEQFARLACQQFAGGGK
jgi:hypothetical protein